MKRIQILAPFLIALLGVGCVQPSTDRTDDPNFGAWGGKADGNVRTLESGVPSNGEIESESDEILYSFSATQGASVHLEVTRTGSSRGLDTILEIYGPSSAAGQGELLATDDEAGYGQLSEIEGLELEEEGDYLVRLTVDDGGSTDLSRVNNFRILLELSGGASGPDLDGDLPKEVHYVRNSAEYVAIVSQGYALASMRLNELERNGELPDSWAVALDVDETIMSNSQYRKERGLGAGTTWWEWVSRREATLLPGALEFITQIQDMGGTVALVTNRHVSQCTATADNLESVGVTYDVILCQDGDREKESRWQSVEDGTARSGLPAAEIVLWIGDNIHDFRGMDQHHRDDASNFRDFGTRFIAMPNPMSGSWSRNPQN